MLSKIFLRIQAKVHTEKEIDIIDSNLQKHVQTHGMVSGYALSFAYYYLVKCLCQLNKSGPSSQITAALEKLQELGKGDSVEGVFDFYSNAEAMSIEQSFKQPVVSS